MINQIYINIDNTVFLTPDSRIPPSKVSTIVINSFYLLKWPSSLILIDIPDSVITPEVKSLEKQIQADREKNTLAMLLFKPDTATEPDINNYDELLTNLKTKIIPIDDV